MSELRKREAQRTMALDTLIGGALADSPYGELRKFLEDLLDPEAFGHAVTEEVRNEARKLLGIKPIQTVYSQKPVCATSRYRAS